MTTPQGSAGTGSRPYAAGAISRLRTELTHPAPGLSASSHDWRILPRLVSLLALPVALVLAPVVRADGDPASDTLVYTNVFFPYPAPSHAAQAALTAQVAAAYRAGYWLKVAVIASKTDLGAIPSLYGKPGDYAKFLGQEISGLYVGPLLITMSSGYGIYDGGRSTTAEERVLARLPAPASSKPDDVTAAATTAAKDLLAAGALKSKDILAPMTGVVSARLARGTLSVVFHIADDSAARP
jgi:hypothetical protein